MIFVDTGAWFASAVPDDARHVQAKRWLDSNSQPLLTTDYVVDETLTLLKARGFTSEAIEVGEMFFSGQLARLLYLTETDIQSAWSIFRRYRDKEWSFTDCTSKVIIERLGIQQAFAFDHHFRQFGSVTVVPS